MRQVWRNLGGHYYQAITDSATDLNFSAWRALCEVDPALLLGRFGVRFRTSRSHAEHGVGPTYVNGLLRDRLYSR